MLAALGGSDRGGFEDASRRGTGRGCALEKEVPGIDREGAPSQGRACDGGGNW